MPKSLSLHPRLELVLQILCTAVLYFILGRLSLLLQFESSHATPVWPPSGFAFAILLIWGFRIAPGILIGAFAANLLNFIQNQTVDLDTSLWLSFLIGLGNTTESCIGAYLMRQLFPQFSVTRFFEKVSDVFAYSLVAILMCLVGSSIGSSLIYLSGIIDTKEYPIVLATWWLGDFAGILLVTTFIFLWLKSIKGNSPVLYTGWARKAEVVALYISTFFASGIIFDSWFAPYPVFHWSYWVIPITVWAALRFGQRELITVIAITTIIAISGTIHHHGPFGKLGLNDALLSVQAFVSILVITKLTLNISILERRRTEKILRHTGSELELRVKKRTAQLEERTQFAETLIENSPYMILAYDKQLHFTTWNRKSEEHTGLSKKEVLGKHTFDVFPEYNNEKWWAITRQVLEEGKSLHFPKVQFQHKQGWGESFVTPLVNPANEVLGLLSITREITDLVNMTSDLEQKNQDLEHINKELSSFAYASSHDLQEPLRKIQMFSKRIVETDQETLSENGKDYFNRINNAAQRMQQLIENLISYSRTSTGERNFEKIPISQVLEEVKEELKDELASKNTVIESDIRCSVMMNPFQVRQLLHNLVSNSLKFSDPVRPLVIRVKSHTGQGKALSFAKLEPDRVYCHIILKDNGIGFDPQYNEQIFGLFQRLYGKSEYPGTGIGLAICKKIVENHSGYITAEGDPGIGATFHIYLPVEQTD